VLVLRWGKSSIHAAIPRCRVLIMKAPVAAGLAVGIIGFVVLFSTIKLSSGVGNVDGAGSHHDGAHTMCFGTCPAHSLAIHGNRTVNYEGFAFVAVTGSHTYQISKEKVEQLARASFTE
jgi:hypothetical protein